MQEQISTVQKLINTAVEFCVNYSFQVVGAIIILIVGSIIAGWAANFLLSVFQKKKMDITLSGFLSSIVKGIILAFALLIALGKFGITITPFIAAFSAVAFGASLAIQGPLTNYGAGISIILSRPFVVGDTITVANVSGLVHEVKLACTVLTDEDGVRITIPNKDIVGQIIYNSKQYKIVEAVVGISYDSNPEAAIRAVPETLKKFSYVPQNPKAQIGIQQFADSSINIGYRYWVPTAKYYQTLYAVNLAIQKSFEAANIKMPFPQREIRIINQPAGAQS